MEKSSVEKTCKQLGQGKTMGQSEARVVYTQKHGECFHNMTASTMLI